MGSKKAYGKNGHIKSIVLKMSLTPPVTLNGIAGSYIAVPQTMDTLASLVRPKSLQMLMFTFDAKISHDLTTEQGANSKGLDNPSTRLGEGKGGPFARGMVLHTPSNVSHCQTSCVVMESKERRPRNRI